MTDMPNDPGFAARAADSLTDAKHAVDSATDEVVRTSRRFESALRRSEFPRSVLGLVADVTRVAPLGMLSVAFLAGVMFASRNRSGR